MPVIHASGFQVDSFDQILLPQFAKQAIQRAGPQQFPVGHGAVDGLQNVDTDPGSIRERREYSTRNRPKREQPGDVCGSPPFHSFLH